jgi:hypothetical protein
MIAQSNFPLIEAKRSIFSGKQLAQINEERKLSIDPFPYCKEVAMANTISRAHYHRQVFVIRRRLWPRPLTLPREKILMMKRKAA